MSAEPPFTPPPYNPTSGILYVKGLDQICAYYEQFRPGQMESFAQFVIEKGHGARSPRKDSKTGDFETWQGAGRRLFGERFIPIMERAIEAHRAKLAKPQAIAAPPPKPAVIPEPDF